MRLAGPSGVGSVIMELKVNAGDWVEGQLIAILDSYAVRKADQARLQAELDNARKKLAREVKLSRAVASSAATVENLELNVKAAEGGDHRGQCHGGAVNRRCPQKARCCMCTPGPASGLVWKGRGTGAHRQDVRRGRGLRNGHYQRQTGPAGPRAQPALPAP